MAEGWLLPERAPTPLRCAQRIHTYIHTYSMFQHVASMVPACMHSCRYVLLVGVCVCVCAISAATEVLIQIRERDGMGPMGTCSCVYPLPQRLGVDATEVWIQIQERDAMSPMGTCSYVYLLPQRC